MEQLHNTTSERVDDLPVIINWLSQMQIQFLLDQELPTPRGNRQSFSYSQLAVLLLTYILTQADHIYYREQWQPEMGFHRFGRGQLPALPIYFQDESRIKGLMFFLTIALQVFTLIEFVVRRQLLHHDELWLV